MLNTLAQISATHLSDETVLALRVALRLLHFIGLVLGLGAATLLDLMLFKRRKEPLTDDMVATVEMFSKVVFFGLALLWISGVGFLLHYAQFDPQKLANPKVLAKIVIVFILSINGFFIHSLVLPHIRANVGWPCLAQLNRGRRWLFCSIGAVSAVSWYAPLLLGAVPQFNFVVPTLTILTGYAIILSLAMLAAIVSLLPQHAPQNRLDMIGAR
ncbi:hypothetical protein [Azospirillum cavernae]|uniref:hypothetical protein n=1 Tax=Azospirillum cavernae TaxID=2320860 RepID=UPI0018F350DA|nr:hypothetical protein [Azospirillum cavernae]